MIKRFVTKVMCAASEKDVNTLSCIDGEMATVGEKKHTNDADLNTPLLGFRCCSRRGDEGEGRMIQ